MADITPIANGEPGSSVRSKLNAAIAELNARPENNLAATTAPTVTDDSGAGYAVRSLWFDTTAGETYRCMDATAGAAVWVKTSLTLDELGSAATQDTGTTSGTVPLLELDSESNPALPAVSGLKLTKLAGELVRYSETSAAATATIDRADGGKQTLTLTADVTLTITMANNEDMELTILNGDSWAVTWPAGDWLGGSLPTLAAKTRVVIDKDSTGTLNFSRVGDYS